MNRSMGKTKTRPLGMAAVACGWALLAGCQPRPEATWFPLTPGYTQTYEVRYESASNPDADTGLERPPERWTQTVREPRSWNDTQVHVRHHSAGVEFLFERSEAGIRRVALRADIDAEPTEDDPPRWVLKAPYAVGTEWTTTSVPYLLRRKNEYPYELVHTHRVLMNWRIEAVDDAVTTPAGRFSPCLRVVGLGQLNLYTDPVNGFTNVPIESREWFCMGHGLVRWERSETVPPGFFSGGKVTAELVP